MIISYDNQRQLLADSRHPPPKNMSQFSISRKALPGGHDRGWVPGRLFELSQEEGSGRMAVPNGPPSS